MKWLDAFKQVDKPTWTNREAAGLVTFARQTWLTYVQKPSTTLTDFDWYPFALAVLGWEKPGDKFKIDTKYQLQNAPSWLRDQLRAALITMSTELDESKVPFRLVVDPRGSDAAFRKLASDAWAAMQTLAKQGIKSKTLTHDVIDWPEVVAVKESPLAAAAGKTTKPKKEPEQMPLPGVVEAQPVGKPIAVETEKKKGGGGAWFLLLLAVASTRKRRGGKR